MRLKVVLGIFFGLVCSIPIQAQAVIGSNKIPEKFSVLELISTTGGLRYPQLNSVQMSALNATLNASSNSLAEGLVIFRTDNAGNLEYYNGTGWTVVYTPFITHPARPFSTQGVEITGPDIITVPGNVSSVGRQTYQVKFSGNISGISDLKVGKYLDFDNVVQSVTLNNASIGSSNEFELTFRQRAIDLIKESSAPIRFTLYATYNDNGTMKEIDIEIKLTKNIIP
jgi:hypothetical protein